MPQPIDPARCRALLVGIDGYPGRPLTSAVNDVDLVHAALRDLDLVAEANIVRLVSPAPAGGLPATRRNLGAALFALYDDEAASEIERFYFFFAGHGIAAFSGPTRGEARTALLPVDVESLDLDGNLLLDFDDLHARMRFRGPREQLYFVDACRDLPYKRQPDVGPLGWSERPRGAERSQAVLYAVPPLGQARADRGGLGTMTRHLVEALHGRGEALDWDDELEAHVVTMRSVHAYVARAVLAAVSGEPAWKQKYSEPRLEQTDPGPRPLRVIDPATVPDVDLAVHVEPEEAAPRTRVQVYLRGQPVGVGWPPHGNHDRASLRPLRYALRARALDGSVEAERISIDARVQRDATVRVVPLPPAGSGLERSPAFLAAPAAMRSSSPGEAIVSAVAHDPEATIDLVGLDPPYARFAAGGDLTQEVAPGAYRVSFRLGPEVFHEAEIDVAAGEARTVRLVPPPAPSPLVREVLAGKVDRRRFFELTLAREGGLAETLLAALGLTPFPAWRLPEYAGLVAPCDPAALDGPPVALVTAADGDAPEAAIHALLDDLRYRLLPPGVAGSAWSELSPLREAGAGLHRLRTAVEAAPAASFVIELRPAEGPSIRVPAASLPGHATVVAVVLAPDGSVGVSQHVLPLDAQSPDGRLDLVRVRKLVIGQLLHRRGELLLRGKGSPLLGDVVQGRRLDPVLSAMSFFARARGEGTALDLAILRDLAQGVGTRFAAVPDSAVIGALASPHDRDARMTALLDAGAVPILAESARFLAEDAVRLGRGDAPVVEWVRRIPAGSIWAIHVG